MSTDEELEKTLKQLSLSYDSSVYYLNAYQQKIKEFPIKNYNQEFTIKEIITYRLDGLTGANFLKNQIELWDYNTWVKKIYDIKNSDINDLRAEIIKTDKELNAGIDFFKYSKINNDNFTGYKVSEMLKFRIGKYDHQSIVLDFFDYKENKINFMVNSRKRINSIDDTTKISFLQRARFYQSLLGEWILVSENLNNFSAKITDYHIQKYYDFFKSTYSGMDGLNNLVKEEKQLNDREINLAFSNLKFFLRNEDSKYLSNLNFIPYKKYNIPLFIQNPDYNNLIPKQLISLCLDEDNEGNKYISGIYLQENKNTTQAFVAKVNSKNITEWIQFLDIKSSIENSHQIGKLVQALDDGGCMVIVNINAKTNGENIIQNTLVRLNSSGKTINKINLYRNFIPQFLKYDEINEKYIIAYKGEDINETSLLEKMYIDLNDSSGNNIWNQTMEIEGNIINIINLNQDYLIFANINKFINGEGNLVKIKNGSALLYSYLDKDGNIKHMQIYEAQEPYFSTKVIKLNNTLINILGYKGTFDYKDLKINGSEPLFYMLIDPTGKKIYANLNY